jgi:hypothetical protein
LKEDTLKDRVRETLSELDTGTSNEKRSSVATLQSVEVMKKLRLTDGHASRNVLSHRNKLILGKPSFLSTPESSTESTNVAPPEPLEQVPVPAKRSTKFDVLADQRDTMKHIAAAIKEATETKVALVQDKRLLLAAKITASKLLELKEMRAIGIINEEDFLAEVRILYGRK